MFNQLCMPALIYLVFMFVHISIDLYYNQYNLAIVKIGVCTLGTLLLNILCLNELSVVAWIFIFIPFIMMTIISIFILYLGLDPSTGKNMKVTTDPPAVQPSIYANPIDVNTPFSIYAQKFYETNS